ncbi:hypothetical protein IAQ61_008420 [Plenodomus lingam]|nr:hypothetical protein IAQ61_008420 [Plenodomus lingam]
MTEVLSSNNEIAGDAGVAKGQDGPQKDILIEELDELLERYLHTLDEYQRFKDELSKQLSSGFMSLAQANFHNSSSAIRYGQDCYDDRMQAIRKVHISEGSDDDPKAHFSIKSQDLARSANSSEKDISEEQKSGDFSPDTNEESAEKPRQDTETPSNGSSVEPRDPLRWFGILVPPALRTAQSTFITAVEGPIARIATVAMDLRSQEIEIGRMRKQIKKLSA